MVSILPGIPRLHKGSFLSSWLSHFNDNYKQLNVVNFNHYDNFTCAVVCCGVVNDFIW